MSHSQTAVIIGGSHATAQLIPSLRQEGWEGRIVVVSDDSQLPYHRPPLSKTYLSGEKTAENLLIRKPPAYERLDVEWQLNTRAERIDRDRKTIELDNGETLAYDKLALCTGARVRTLDIPGNTLEGIHYLRDLADAEAIKQDIKPGGHALIVGGGYIGLEAAALLKKLGMEVDVLVHSERILRRVTAPLVSDFYTRVHTEEGVRIHTNEVPQEFKGDGHVAEVVCASGNRFAADLVIVGIGVEPNIELAEAAGLEIDDGILVDKYAVTSDPDIVAAGDCTKHPNVIYGRNLRLESVPNATEQAMSAAASICGNRKEYKAVPWFWSDQFDLKLQMAGLNDDFDEVAIRGDSDNSRSFTAWYYKDGKLVAADCIGRPMEFRLAQTMLKEGREIPVEQLVDDSIDVKELLAQIK